jgi:hypothetical protein
MKKSVRTHERVVNKHCPSCGANKGHRYVEVKQALWLRAALLFSIIGIFFLKTWKTQCTGCGSIN